MLTISMRKLQFSYAVTSGPLGFPWAQSENPTT